MPCPFYPDDPTRSAKIDMWLDWIATRLNPVFGTLRRAKDAEATRQVLPAAAETFGLLDAHLKTRPLLVGDDLTLADVALSPRIMRLFALDLELPIFANLERYHERLRRDANYLTHVEAGIERP